MTGFRHISDSLVHQGWLWRVAVSQFEAPDGEQFTRDIVRSPGAVAAVPLLFDAEGNPSVVLVRQYRPAFDDHMIEIPAGMRDVDDEPTEVTAHRELIEEVGLDASQLDPLILFYPAVGMTDATVHVYLATDLTAVERQTHGPEEAHSDVLHIPLSDALAMVERGEIRDSKTVIGLLLTERRLREGDTAT